MELPAQLKANRERLDLSQEDVAHAIFVSRQTISSWENGKTYPDVQSLLLLSQLFGASIDDLVKGDVVAMQETVSKDALRMERLMAGSAVLLLLGLGCMIGFYAVLPEPSIVPHMSIGSIVGVLAFAAFWISSAICTKRIERIKHDHNLISYREISAFMDGREISDASEALSRRGSRSSFAFKIFCGFGIGFVCAFLITTVANSIL